jgi:hypothetical protein
LYLLIYLLYNEGDTNKLYYVINFLCVETVCVGQFSSFIIDYLRVDHTKIRVDLLFANTTTILARKNYFNHLYVIAWFF